MAEGHNASNGRGFRRDQCWQRTAAPRSSMLTFAPGLPSPWCSERWRIRLPRRFALEGQVWLEAVLPVNGEA